MVGEKEKNKKLTKKGEKSSSKMRGGEINQYAGRIYIPGIT